MLKNLVNSLFKHNKKFLLGAILSLCTTQVTFSQATLPLSVTESVFNDGSVVTKSKEVDVAGVIQGKVYMEKGEIFLGTKGASGFYWDPKYINISFTDVPESISFEVDTKAVLFGCTTKHLAGVFFYVQEAPNLSELPGEDNGRIWKTGEQSGKFKIPLKNTTRCVRIAYVGNYQGILKNIKITAKYYNLKTIEDGVTTRDEMIKPYYATNIADPVKACYTANWDAPAPAVMPESDVLLTAEYTLKRFTANYKVSDATLGVTVPDYSETYDCGSSITVADPSQTGYTFLKWTPSIPTEATESMDGKTYTAQWRHDEYTYTIQPENGEDDIVEKKYYGDPLSADDPVKTGYTFSGWHPEIPATMPTADVTVAAQWTANDYTLTLQKETPDAIDETITYHYEDPIAPINEPTKTGYKFVGWDPEIPATMPASDVTVTAQWRRMNFTLTLVKGLGLEDEVLEYIYGDDIEVVAPSKIGYEFVGWEPAIPATMPDQNISATAQWKQIDYTLTLKKGLDFDPSQEEKTFHYNDPVSVPDLEHVGYTFKGWKPVVPETMPNEDVTCEAQWEANEYHYVVYTSDVDSVDQIYLYGETIAPLDDPDEKEGYTFAGWDVASPATMPAHDVRIHANWTVNSYNITLLVDGEEYLKQAFDYGATVSLKNYTDPEKTGYTFTGWDKNLPATMPAKDQTFEAQFDVNRYCMTVVNDEENPSANDNFCYDYGKKVSPLIDPEKEGYTFAGWNQTIPTTMPAENLLVKAQWTANDYTLTFKNEGEVYKALTYHFGETIDYTGLTDPERTGYLFLGWGQTLPTTMPSNDVEFTAQWSTDAYTLTIVNEEGVAEKTITKNYEYGAKIDRVVAPTKEGYTFKGWDKTIPTTMPAEDMTITAQWQINDYTLTTLVNCKPTETTYTYGDAVSVENPSEEGYQFNGWTPAIPTTMPGEDLLVIADMQLLSFNFIVNIDDKSETIPYLYGESIKTPTEPWKEGFTFKGWDAEIPATMPAKDVTVTAEFERNRYNVYFVSDNDTIESANYAYEEGVAQPTVKPTKEGYTFMGWDDEIPATMPADSLLFNAEWKINRYVFAVVSEEDTTSLKYDFGETLKSIEEPERVGYTFAGWSKEIPATMPAYDDTIVAQWTINTYEITWEVDGEKEVKSYQYDAPVINPNDPEKDGYTFDGWNAEIPENMPASDLNFVATFSVNSYLLTWNTGEEMTTEKYNFGEEIKEVKVPEKEGYTFAGWDKEIPATMPSHDDTLTATWKINYYQITWLVDEKAQTVQVKYGEEITLPNDPEKEGYTFEGWGDVPSSMPAENLTYQAKWSVNTYKITWVVDGEETVSEFEYGEIVITPSDPTKEGYRFTGWDKDIPATMPANDVTLTATWNVDAFTIVWVVDGQETAEKYNSGEIVVSPDDPRKEGYTFVGWDKDIPATMPSYNDTLTAKWEVNTYSITWVVDEQKTTEEYEFASVVVSPDDPEKEGYTFKGWDKEIPSEMPSHNDTLTATWSIKTYEITWVVDGESKTEQVKYASTVEKPADPTKEGYTFKGWDEEIPTEMPAKDLTFTAEFTTDSFTISIVIMDGKTLEKKYGYGDKVEEPENPVREGYDFIGWSAEIPTTMPLEDLMIEAQWKAKEYTLTFDPGDGNIIRVTEHFGDPLAEDVKDFTEDMKDYREGYTFDGWEEEAPDSMPSHDITEHAKWKKNSHSVTFVTSTTAGTKSFSYQYGDTIKMVKDPVKKGYTFLGWDSELPELMPDNDITVRAQWDAKQYKVNLVVDGRVRTEMVTYGDSIPLEKEKKLGYIFRGWDRSVPNTMPAKDLTFVAKFVASGKLIVYSEDGTMYVTGLPDDAIITVWDALGKMVYQGKGRRFGLTRERTYIIKGCNQVVKHVVR